MDFIILEPKLIVDGCKQTLAMLGSPFLAIVNALINYIMEWRNYLLEIREG